MIVRVVSEQEYFSTFPTPRTVYGSQDFNRVTAPNAEAVRFFIGYDENMAPRLGIILGYRGGEWHAPYSSPFTEIAYRKPQSLECIYDFISELTAMLGAHLHISLPPDFYDPAMLPAATGVLANFAEKTEMDYDFYYDLSQYTEYKNSLDHTARKNLTRAEKSGLTFAKTDDIDRAYQVIRTNREQHGYSLAMSLEQVKATVNVVTVDFFLLSLGEQDVAAAMVYHVAPGIVQVIYWGNVDGYNEFRPMNLLACRIFGHYNAQGLRIVDVGPSSTHGIPNVGLCRFKQSVGCSIALKPSFKFC